MATLLNGCEFGQTLGDTEGQGSLVCCSPWGCKESDTTEQLDNSKIGVKFYYSTCGDSAFPTPCIEEIIIFLLSILGFFVKH